MTIIGFNNKGFYKAKAHLRSLYFSL